MKEKFLVFVYHRAVAEALHEHFKAVSVLVYGGMTANQKQQSMEAFMIGDARLLIAQVNSAGEGIDGLQRVCNKVVIVEPDWVPGGYDQNIGRLRRIGQDKPIDVVTLVAEGTYDEVVIGSRQRKQRTIDLFYDHGRLLDKKEELTMSIENSLESIAASLKVLAENVVGGVAKGLEKAVQQPAKPEAKEVKAAETKNGQAVAGKKVTADDVRAAAMEVLQEQGDSDNLKKQIRDIVIAHGGKTGKADSVPAGKMSAAREAILALAGGGSEESSEGGIDI